MPTTYYHTVDGKIQGETTAGVRTDYLTDALGSVVATVNSSAQVVNTYRYKPSGSLLASTGNAPDPRFLHVGSLGIAKTGLGFAEGYMRARHYTSVVNAFTTRDPVGEPDARFLAPYIYVRQSPTTLVDPSGLHVCPPNVDCCNDVDWGGSVGARCSGGQWVECPSPPQLFNQCRQYLKSNDINCNDAKDLIRRLASECVKGCSGEGYGGGVQWDAATLCCKDSSGWRGCTRCCSNAQVGSSPGIKSCQDYCLLVHEASHQIDCAKFNGSPPLGYPECCAYHSQARCVFAMFMLACGWTYADGRPDFGYVLPMPDCIKRAGERHCPGAKW